MDLQVLLRDKRFLAAAGVVTAVGVYVLYRRSLSSSSSTTSPGAVAASGAAAPGIDTTGSDLASWLDSYQSTLQDDLTQYGNQLSTALAGVSQIPTAPNGTSSPPPTPAPSSASTKISVPLGTSLYDWTRQVGSGYQLSGGFDINKLRQLNPGIDTHIMWITTASGKIPQFRPGTGPVRIR